MYGYSFFGAVVAERYEQVKDYMWRYRYLLATCAILSDSIHVGRLLLCHGCMALYGARSDLHSASVESNGCILYGIGHIV